MKKTLLTFLAIACISVASFAQGRISIGAEAALPMGDWADLVGFGMGGSVRYEAPINEKLSWTATAGFLSFGKKEVDFGGSKLETSSTMIPIQGGVKYYFTESFNGFYAGAEVGVHMVKFKVEAGGVSADVSETEVSYAPALGYHLGSIDISARYQMVSDANYLGFRIAYVLGGK